MKLREATAELHSKAEKMEFNQRMFRGELSTDEYAKYLHQQFRHGRPALQAQYKAQGHSYSF